jgi:hypothetical protein
MLDVDDPELSDLYDQYRIWATVDSGVFCHTREKIPADVACPLLLKRWLSEKP